MQDVATDDDNAALLWDFQVNAAGALTGSDSAAFRWTHIRCDLAESDQLLRERGVSATLREALTAEETRPRCADMDEGTLLVLRGLNTNPGADPEDMVAIRIWFDATNVITSRRRSRQLMSVRDLRLALEAGQGPRSATALVAETVERLADRIGVFVDEIEEALEAAEAPHNHRASASKRRHQLTELRRDTALIRRYLAPQREALETLLRIGRNLDESTRQALREQTDRTVRYLEDLELARERTVLAQEELRSEIAEQQNARMYVLSLITAIFLPLSFLTGVFGMNVAGLPGTENSAAFVWLALFMVGVAAFVTALLKYKRWL